MTATQYAAALASNADAVWAGRITHEAHRASNRALWQQIEARSPSFKALVLSILRAA